MSLFVRNKGNMRYGLLIGLLCAVCAACSSELKTDEQAANTARLYYDYLVQGKYDDFVAGIEGYDEMPDTYRRQLSDNARMFVEQQNREHGGIERLRIMRADIDSDTETAQVFLVISYQDGGNEQIMVPMVRKGQLWLMR